jgi:hypothetical protein
MTFGRLRLLLDTVARKHVPGLDVAQFETPGENIPLEAGLLLAAAGLRLVPLPGISLQVAETGSPDALNAMSAPERDGEVFTTLPVHAEDGTSEV